eukprot:6492208-Amphidinium_carterae.2
MRLGNAHTASVSTMVANTVIVAVIEYCYPGLTQGNLTLPINSTCGVGTEVHGAFMNTTRLKPLVMPRIALQTIMKKGDFDV